MLTDARTPNFSSFNQLALEGDLSIAGRYCVNLLEKA